jgi:hypothetical protein
MPIPLSRTENSHSPSAVGRHNRIRRNPGSAGPCWVRVFRR